MCNIFKDAKDNFRQQAKKDPVFMRLDCPDPYGSGGNTDTANNAKRFLSEEKREAILTLFPNASAQKLDNIRSLLQGFNVVLRVVSSKSRIIDTNAFDEYCIETYVLLKTVFPWASVPQSIHRLFGHSAERIALNGGYGLGNLSEEALESLHKLVRRFRSLLARKTNLRDNLADVFKHLFIRFVYNFNILYFFYELLC